MTKRMLEIIAKNRVAIITGAAKGISAALAHRLAYHQMRLVLVDMDQEALNQTAEKLDAKTVTIVGNITDNQILKRLYNQTIKQFGDVALVINNAAITNQAGPWDSPEKWRQTLDVNFTAVLAIQHLFVPYMIQANKPAAIVNLGSKEGITTPPGNAAYSVSKAAIKVITEQLSHELINATNGLISAHLLVPGYT